MGGGAFIEFCQPGQLYLRATSQSTCQVRATAHTSHDTWTHDAARPVALTWLGADREHDQCAILAAARELWTRRVA